jgi:enoyl-CoA hydratase/carnithine racemase
MTDKPILIDRHEHVVVLTLNNPERLNAINDALRTEFHAAIKAARDDDQVRAMVITGAGKGFCSGVDVSALGSPDPEITSRQNELLDEEGKVGRWAKRLFYFDKPLIAAVNGIAAGAGMATAMAADMRVGSEHARFKSVFIERSLSPDSGLSYFLPRVIGYARAADLIFTSRTVEAEEAYRLGLLDRLVAHEVLVEEAVKLAQQMTRWPPLALRSSKRVLQQNMDTAFEDALKAEMVGLGFGRRGVNDAKESVLAFQEKRKPTYTGT